VTRQVNLPCTEQVMNRENSYLIRKASALFVTLHDFWMAVHIVLKRHEDHSIVSEDFLWSKNNEKNFDDAILT
jgi:hypothetical protein